MTFDEAIQRFRNVKSAYDEGRIDARQYSEEVRKLSVQDANGQWWHVDSGSGGWLQWDGSAWVTGAPPAPPPLAVSASGPQTCSKCGAVVRLGRKFCGSCGAPVTAVSTRAEKHEPQPPAGAAGSGPQTCPKCGVAVRRGRKFCGACGAPISGTAPLEKGETQPVSETPELAPAPAPRALSRWGPRIWNVFAVGGCGGVAGLWYWYSGLSQETPPDTKTCVAIVALPLVVILLRPLLDRLLRPLEPLKQSIPRMVRLGIGIAMPFLVSNYLYARGYSQFDYMFRTVVISAVLSFFVLASPSKRVST